MCRFEDLEFVTLSFGENLGEYEGYQSMSEDELAETMIDKWLKSPRHRANLLSKDFNRQGIGVSAKNGRVVLTVIFTKQ